MPHPLQKLERFALGNVRTRGAQYFAQHRVEIRSIDDDIHAHVIGTRRYEVVVSPQHFDLHAACTCEYFLSEASICKHIWATLLAAYERGVEFVRLATRLTGDESLLDQIDVDTDEVEPPALRNARDAQRQPWQTFFQTLSSRSRHELPRTTTTPDVPEQILYVLDSVRFGGTSAIIYTFGRFAKKSGALGAARKVKLSSSTIAKLPDAEDRELAALLASDYDIAMSEAKLSVLLPRVAATGRLYLSAGGNDLRGPLRLDDRVWQFKVSVDPKSESYLIAGRFVSNGDVIRLEDVDRLVQSGWFVAGDRLARFTSEGSGIWLDALHTHGDVTVPKSAHSQLAAALAASPQTSLEAPPELQIVDVQPSPKLRLTRELGDSWRGEFRVVYGEEEVDPASLKAGSAGGRYIRRRTDIERAMRERLTELNFRGWGGSEVYIQDKDLPKALAALAADDWRIEVGGERLFAEGDLSLEVVSGIDWFDVEGRATFGDRVVEMPRLLAAVRNRESFLSLPGGGVAMIDDEWSSRLQELAASAGQGDTSRLRFARNQATFIDALFAAKGGLSVDRDYENLRKRLQSADAVEPRMEPPGFGTELRPYQRIGLAWLFFLREVGFGGCLADDMGLGKTVQALALLETLRQQAAAEERRPSLIVAPRSLMFNWKAEAERFTPQLRVLDHHGIDRIKGSEHFGDYDLILTTYATLQRDLMHLASVELEYVILDEAQAIKNASSQSAKAVKALSARHRLALSGTPIENHIGELWSIFDFLNPGMLGSARSFSRAFGSKNAPPDAREKLARIVRPFVLRRTKQMVLPELPDKDEQTLWVELSDTERREYDELRAHYRALLLERVSRDGLAKSKMYVLEALLRLRQASLHPGLIDATRAREGSAKLDALEAELAILLDSGHKVLVFSQFTGLLDIVQDRVEASGIGFVRLDGRSRNREELVKQFQTNDRVQLFLISLKAGGVGLNLTAADYVYLLDPWWNPAVEAQAIDRAHRIGQLQKVTATRIVASDTVEEKILELQRHKKALADSIIQADDALLSSLDLADLEMLLS